MSDFVTYRHIRDALNELSDEQLDMTASIYESDTMEVFGISDTYTVENLPDNHRKELDGVVEDNQPLFVVGSLNQEQETRNKSGYVYAVSKSLGVEIGEWKVNLVVDDDGHLGVNFKISNTKEV